MKITNIICAFLFLLFAVVQYNDPDPWTWIAAYIYVALLFVLQLKGILNKKMLLPSLIIFGVWGLTFIPDFMAWLQMGAPNIAGEMKTEEPHIELVREFGGLLICLAGMAFLWRQQKK